MLVFTRPVLGRAGASALESVSEGLSCRSAGSFPCVCREWDRKRLCTLCHCLACLSRGLLGGGVSKPPLPPPLAPWQPGCLLPSSWERSPGLTLHCLPSLKQIPLSVPISPRCLRGISPELPALPSTPQSGSLWVSHPRGCIWCLWPGASRRGPDWTAHLAQAIFTSRAHGELCSNF